MTHQWGFVAAAYAVTALGTLIVLWQSWRAMRAAEQRVERMTHGKDEISA